LADNLLAQFRDSYRYSPTQQLQNDRSIFVVYLYRPILRVTKTPRPGRGDRVEEGRFIMKFRDLFVPRWQHSNPEVRRSAVRRLKDISLLNQISETDDHQMVRDAALEQLEALSDQQVRVSESE
jgi:hypothetical protein